MLLGRTLCLLRCHSFEKVLWQVPRLPNLFQDTPTCLDNYWVLRPKRDRSTSRGRPKDREEAGDYLEGGGLCKSSEGFLIEDPQARC